jgi:hypothetical protein
MRRAASAFASSSVKPPEDSVVEPPRLYCWLSASERASTAALSAAAAAPRPYWWLSASAGV